VLKCVYMIPSVVIQGHHNCNKLNKYIFSLFLQALDTFNTAVVSPIYYTMFTSLTILASVIMFKVTIFGQCSLFYVCWPTFSNLQVV